MDLIAIIQDLREERKKLDQIITSLEQLQHASGRMDEADMAEPRRGRRSMDAEARMEVSRRMKKYWALKREHAGTAP